MRDDDELNGLAREALRQELHAAVDRVMNVHGTDPRARDALKGELHTALDAVVNDHVAAESASGRLMDGVHGAWSRVQTVPETVDAATGRLGRMVDAAVEGVRPRVKQGASALAELVPRLTPLVMDMLVKFADDPERMRAAQLQAEKLLTRYMEPKRARWIVAAAVKAVESAAKNRRERGQDGPSYPVRSDPSA